MFKPWTNPRRKPRSPGATAGGQDAQSGADEVLAEFEALLGEPCAEQQQQQQMRPGTAPAGGGGQQQQQQPQQARSPSAGRRIGSVTKNADLDWGEFIERQTRFISVRQAKVAAVAEREYSTKGPSPEVSGRGATAMHTARQSA